MAEKDEKPTEPEASPTDEAASDPEPLTQSVSFPLVGIGTSAGGLEALETFFDEMPPDSGIAFVIITHQAPARVSLMPDLLRNHTSMPGLNGLEATRHLKTLPGAPYVVILTMEDNAEYRAAAAAAGADGFVNMTNCDEELPELLTTLLQAAPANESGAKPNRTTR